jgi:hypothetical protein
MRFTHQNGKIVEFNTYSIDLDRNVFCDLVNGEFDDEASKNALIEFENSFKDEESDHVVFNAIDPENTYFTTCSFTGEYSDCYDVEVTVFKR